MKNEIIGVYDQFQHLNFSFIAALLCVPLISKENIKSFLVKADEGLRTPSIICDGVNTENICYVFYSHDFTVKVEDNIVLKTGDFCEGFVVMFT